MAEATAGLDFALDHDERRLLTELAASVAGPAAGAHAHDFFRQAPVLAQELPVRLRQALVGMRQREDTAYARVTGLTVDDEAIGDTPGRWRERASRHRTWLHENQLTLVGSLFGELFGWSGQQDASVIHDVLPMREFENAQINFASQEPIWWHTEDAFHTYRPDYVGLMCLRNPQRAATTVSCASDWDLSEAKFDLLFEERFQQRPDQSHGGAAESAKPRSLLTGERNRPFVCVDPYYLEDPTDDTVAKVLQDFYAVVDSALRQVVLEPGDVLIVDNFRAVHGRKPFRAAYDGRDRWLKRMSVSRDLRRCWPAWTTDSCQVLDSNDH
ncbi:TauD/TfdA family dioxygenase [Streptomyces sp. NBC_01537]|uniref:guanitoxin biosynthesis L-enduracididine beta-hydroxylase GntD n=1 Tax=Streptomyces sp. NBC_01537 TaxID=2903896 RepID=UPI0038703E54